MSELPLGPILLDVFRWLVIAGFGLFAIPIVIYSVLFCNFKVVWEILVGSISSLFYSPTYLVLLNIFALCRIDDISWGTKGDDSASKKEDSLAACWKTLKYIQFYKFLFWNSIVGFVIISFGSAYIPRFFISLGLAVILVLTMIFKIVIGMGYLIAYKIKKSRCPCNKK